MVKKEPNIKKKDNKIIQGVIGFMLSLLGVLFAFQIGTENTLLFAIFLLMIIIGIILVAKAVSE